VRQRPDVLVVVGAGSLDEGGQASNSNDPHCDGCAQLRSYCPRVRREPRPTWRQHHRLLLPPARGRGEGA
jgi:hypothetical protein